VQVKAIDADSGENAQLRYFIDSSDNDLFWIDPATGIVTLLDSIPSDNVTSSVRVTVIDAGTPPLSSTTNLSIVVDSQKLDFKSGAANMKSREAVDQRRLAVHSDTWTALIVVWIACCSGLVSLLILIIVVISVIRRRFISKRVDWRSKQHQQQQQHLVSAEDKARNARHTNDFNMTSSLCGDVYSDAVRCNGNDITVGKHHHFRQQHRQSSH
jgi:heme exporter protein D